MGFKVTTFNPIRGSFKEEITQEDFDLRRRQNENYCYNV